MPKTFLILALAASAAVAQAQTPAVPKTPTDVKPGSINCEDCPYPYPSSYLPLTLYGQDVRIAYMDVAPSGRANGHTVVLLHGNNFAGFYFGGPIDVLREGRLPRDRARTRSATADRRSRSFRTTSTTWRATRARSCST